MIRTPCVFLSALALAFPTRISSACDCPTGSSSAFFKAADMVFVGRATEKPRFSRKNVQRLEVLHALKGKPGRTFTIVRPGPGMSNCDRLFRANAVDLVFVVKGKVELCHGNYGLKWHWKQKGIAPLLRLTGSRTAVPSAAALRAALVAGVGPALQERVVVPVKFAPWTGRRLKLGRTTLRFTRTFPKTVLAIHSALRLGRLHYISGLYHLEGRAFGVLLLERGGKLEVVYRVGEKRDSGRASRGPRLPAPLK